MSFKGQLLPSYVDIFFQGILYHHSNYLIKKLQKQELRMAYHDCNSSFDEHLEISMEITITIEI